MHCTILDTDVAATFHSVRLHRPLVIEFWSTKCQRCPSALAQMNALAASTPGVVFAACAIATSEDDVVEKRKVQALIDGTDDEPALLVLPHVVHLFMNFEQKERAKKRFAFSSVPHCVVFDAKGNECYSGSQIDQVTSCVENFGVPCRKC